MRRLIAVLVLLGGGSTQLAAVHCPLSLSHTEEAAAPSQHTHAHGADHAGADVETQHPAQSDRSSHHPETGCGLTMACGTAVLFTSPAMTTGALPISVPPLAIASRSASTTFPTHEPPPPRRTV